MPTFGRGLARIHRARSHTPLLAAPDPATTLYRLDGVIKNSHDRNRVCAPLAWPEQSRASRVGELEHMSEGDPRGPSCALRRALERAVVVASGLVLTSIQMNLEAREVGGPGPRARRRRMQTSHASTLLRRCMLARQRIRLRRAFT